jgi:hypothetical protein
MLRNSIVFGDSSGSSGLYYCCLIGGVENSTVELSRDRRGRIQEGKYGVGVFMHIGTGGKDKATHLLGQQRCPTLDLHHPMGRFNSEVFSGE